MNEEAQELRRGLEGHFFVENTKLFRAEPWRVCYWTIMSPDDFDDLRNRAAVHREFDQKMSNTIA